MTTFIVEDKFGSATRKRKRENDELRGPEESSSTSSNSEDEDELGELATEAVDVEIRATLNAIRSKDPRVYDKGTTFYQEETTDVSTAGEPKQKPMFLRDYHRENLLNGNIQSPDLDQQRPVSYSEEQATLKKSILGEINALTQTAGHSDGENPGDDFLIAMPRTEKTTSYDLNGLDIENADRDPETYLSNFMAARAWVPTKESKFQAFESDDEEEERKADEFEEAYNLRFEDPARSNEKLRSHARDLVAKYSVRREEKNSRQKRREEERARKEAEKKKLRAEKMRLRKLKVEQAEEKLRQIKRAAGVSSRDFRAEDWAKFVDDEWDVSMWDEEMNVRFGESYYAGQDPGSDEEKVPSKAASKLRWPKKPIWEEDIDIKDLVPDFEDDVPQFSLSEDEAAASAPDHQKTRTVDDKKRTKESKRERRILEHLVDDKLNADSALLNKTPQNASFKYRETSPVDFGLSSRDILMADDAQLNQFVGLKKLATFRDSEKKKRDRKHLGKRGRLRKWRKETFGNEEGPPEGQVITQDKSHNESKDDGDRGVHVTPSAKHKRRRSGKGKPTSAAMEYGQESLVV